MKLFRYLFIAIFFFIWGLNSYRPITRYLDAGDIPSMDTSKVVMVPDSIIIKKDTTPSFKLGVMRYNFPKPKKRKKKRSDSTIMMNALRAAKEMHGFKIDTSLLYIGEIYLIPDSTKRQTEIEDSLYLKNQKRREISRPG